MSSTPSIRLVLLSAVTAAGLMLAGCGQDPAEPPAPAAEASTRTPTADPHGPPSSPPSTPSAADGGGQAGNGSGPDDPVEVAEVPEALEFEAARVSGESFDARELAGSDTVFWFWAPWCSTCAAHADEVAAAAAAHPEVSFVGVAGLSSDVASMQTFVDDYGLRDFPQLADTDGAVYTRFGITQQDTFVLVGDDGSVETVSGYGGSVDLGATIEQAFG